MPCGGSQEGMLHDAVTSLRGLIDHEGDDAA